MSEASPKLFKVAHVIHSDGAGGGPRTVSSHAAYYHNFFDVTVFHGGRGYLHRTCQTMGIRSVRLPLDKISTCFFGAILLWYHLRKLKPNLVLLHGQWAAPLGAIAARLAGVKKMIYVCHWPAFYTDWDLFRIVRNYFCEWIPCRLANRVITISESNRYRYLIRGYVRDEKNLLSIPNPASLELLPTAKMSRRIRKEHLWGEGCCHVVSVGRLSDQKRMDWLLKAWVRVQKEAPEARLWIVGEGPEEARLKIMSRELNLGATCSFLGAKSDGWSFVAASDLVVMTSLYEARGNVVTEAMACGKAIVANDVDGICDSMVDGEEGFLVEPADVDDLADRLIELIRNPDLRKQMGEKGKVSVQKFAKPKILKQYLTVLLELLDEEKGSAAIGIEEKSGL